MGKPDAPPSSDETPNQEEQKSNGKRKRRTNAELGLRNLPVIIKETLTPDEVLQNPEQYKKLGERHHDELDHQPSRLQYQRTIIEEYIKIDTPQEAPLRAPAPIGPIPGAQITPSLAASIVIDKHCDHIPHYRQSLRLFREQSVIIDRKTINQWSTLTAKHLSPIAQSIGNELLDAQALQIDETTMKYLDPEKPKAQTGYLWIMRNPITGAVYYHWHKRRNLDALLELLGYDSETNTIQYQGIIQCDGYTCYEALSDLYTSIQLGACMAHIRRKFIDDQDLKKIPWVKQLLKHIQQLYQIEKHLKNQNAPPAHIHTIRQKHSSPIIDQIETLLTTNQANHRPSESCAKAIHYALGQWEQLKLYLDQGILPIDNNGVENAVRPCKLGLKNYLFFGSYEGGEYNATLYTILESCKSTDINLRAYLEYVIEALHHTPPTELTPAKVAKKWQNAEQKTA